MNSHIERQKLLNRLNEMDQLIDNTIDRITSLRGVLKRYKDERESVRVQLDNFNESREA